MRGIGIPLWEIGELGNVRFAYPAAVPILVKHLACDLRDGVALALVHALTKPYGPSALNAVREFLERRANALSRSDLFAVGNALAANLKRSDIATALELIKNPAYSLAREPIALRTARWRSDDVVSALREYLRGGESPWTAIRALRLAKAWSAADEVRPYAASESAEVRNEAKKYAEAAAKASK
ncbi:MAG TPA: hypothetical protein VFE35_03965 [Candidatus Cybelea sp.]|nr:hypothetical protein [Candidatus Cybelea sp.]